MTEGTEGHRRPVGVAPESGSGRLVVVCDDGSVWNWIRDRSRWEEIPPIPGSLRAAPGAAPPSPGS
jgi:hypothetical protein